MSEHRWSAEFGGLLGSWAAASPTLIVLAGGKALLSDVRAPHRFADQIRSIWFAAHQEHVADTFESRKCSCMVLRFEPGTDVALLHEHASDASREGRATAGAPLVVQLQPAAYFRFLYRRQALATGTLGQASLAERDAMGLLRHTLFHAWPCGQSRILTPSLRQARHRALAFAAQAAISQALACRHPLEELARTLNTSPFHLAHVFRSEIGISLHQYLLHLRLIAALDRLADGEPDLSKLALELGFSHHSHFSSQFRRVIGHSPREVRRMLSAESGVPPAQSGRSGTQQLWADG